MNEQITFPTTTLIQYSLTLLLGQKNTQKTVLWQAWMISSPLKNWEWSLPKRT